MCARGSALFRCSLIIYHLRCLSVCLSLSLSLSLSRTRALSLSLSLSLSNNYGVSVRIHAPPKPAKGCESMPPSGG